MRISSVVLGIALATLSHGQSFRKLDNVLGHFATAYQISDDGRYSTGTMTRLGQSVVRWDMSAPTQLWGNTGTGQTIGQAGGLSANGQVVAGTYGTQVGPFAYDNDAVYWTSGPEQHVPDLPNSNQSFGTDISSTGDVIVGYAMLPQQQSLAVNTVLRYNTATQTLDDLGFFGPPGTGAWIRCDGTGSTIVGSGTGLSSYWTQGTGWVDIPGLLSFGYEVSDNGRYIVGSSKFAGGGPRGMIYDWAASTMLDLGTLGGYCDMYAVSDSQIAVGTSNGFSSGNAVWWRPGVGLRDLNVEFSSVIPAGWHLWEARDITPDGRYILGTATNDQGAYQAFVIDTVPEPSTLLAATLAFATLTRTRRRFANRSTRLIP